MTLARPKTETEIKMIQDYVDDIYGKFIKLVANSRNLDEKSQPNRRGQGMVRLGRKKNWPGRRIWWASRRG